MGKKKAMENEPNEKGIKRASIHEGESSKKKIKKEKVSHYIYIYIFFFLSKLLDCIVVTIILL